MDASMHTFMGYLSWGLWIDPILLFLFCWKLVPDFLVNGSGEGGTNAGMVNALLGTIIARKADEKPAA